MSGTVCAPPNTFQHIGFSEGQVACQMLGHQTRGKYVNCTGVEMWVHEVRSFANG